MGTKHTCHSAYDTINHMQRRQGGHSSNTWGVEATHHFQYAGWSWMRSSRPTKKSRDVTYAGRAALAMSMVGDTAAIA